MAHQPPHFSPILKDGCDVPHPSTYIRGPLEESLTQVDWGSSLEELFSPLHLMHHPSPLSLSIVWLPEGLRGSEGDSSAARRSAMGILDQIQTDLLLQSCLDLKSRRSHHSPYVYEYYKVLHVRHYVVAPELSHQRHGVKIFTTLRSAMSSSSSTLVQEHNPCVCSTRVCHRVSINRYSIIT
jgi:hypothetical protein